MIKLTCNIEGLDTLTDGLRKEIEKKLAAELRKNGAESVTIESVDNTDIEQAMTTSKPPDRPFSRRILRKKL
jgi:hypothetical protein